MVSSFNCSLPLSKVKEVHMYGAVSLLITQDSYVAIQSEGVPVC